MEKYINIYYRYIYLYINIYIYLFSHHLSRIIKNGKMGKWEFFFSPFQTGVVGICQEIRRANSGNLRSGFYKKLLIGMFAPCSPLPKGDFFGGCLKLA